MIGPVPSSDVDGIEAVIHLAGEGIAERRWSAQQKKRIYDSRIVGTRNLILGLSDSPGKTPPVLVCSSAIGFYGDRGDEKLTEKSVRGHDFLSDVCADWEKEVSRASAEIRTVSIRTGIVLGREGGALKKLLPLFQLGLGGPVGDGKQWMSWIHVEDLVRLYVEAATKRQYKGPVNGVAPGAVTNRDFSKALGSALHRPSFLPAPAFALKAAMGELSTLVLSSQRVVPQSAIENGFSFRFPEIQSALTEIVQRPK